MPKVVDRKRKYGKGRGPYIPNAVDLAKPNSKKGDFKGVLHTPALQPFSKTDTYSRRCDEYKKSRAFGVPSIPYEIQPLYGTSKGVLVRFSQEEDFFTVTDELRPGVRLFIFDEKPTEEKDVKPNYRFEIRENERLTFGNQFDTIDEIGGIVTTWKTLLFQNNRRAVKATIPTRSGPRLARGEFYVPYSIRKLAQPEED